MAKAFELLYDESVNHESVIIKENDIISIGYCNGTKVDWQVLELIPKHSCALLLATHTLFDSHFQTPQKPPIETHEVFENIGVGYERKILNTIRIDKLRLSGWNDSLLKKRLTILMQMNGYGAKMKGACAYFGYVFAI